MHPVEKEGNGTAKRMRSEEVEQRARLASSGIGGGAARGVPGMEKNMVTWVARRGFKKL